MTGYGGCLLYRNNGNGTFTATAEAVVTAWAVSAAFLDYDNDGRLDLFVARYLDWGLQRNILCGTPFHAYCRPDKFNGVSNVLFHNEGEGRFRDVSRESGIAAVTGKGMGVAVNDYDGDGFPDIFVANDGRADIVVTNLALEKYALYRNEGDGRFSYASLTSGLAGLTSGSSGWGVGIHDFDNDGMKDIFAAQSHVLDNVARIHSGLRLPYSAALEASSRLQSWGCRRWQAEAPPLAISTTTAGSMPLSPCWAAAR